jgi:hypothetical protein
MFLVYLIWDFLPIFITLLRGRKLDQSPVYKWSSTITAVWLGLLFALYHFKTLSNDAGFAFAATAAFLILVLRNMRCASEPALVSEHFC